MKHGASLTLGLILSFEAFAGGSDLCDRSTVIYVPPQDDDRIEITPERGKLPYSAIGNIFDLNQRSDVGPENCVWGAMCFVDG